ncbi:ABC transporter substrate-binding protein [Microbispora sp. NPDC046933]|uniref:ABC transporter substrate-binding protein n=1 Tax=Microbispora sp. NPDC046933 TaxID=3155618 RepID=UPI0033D18DEA
MGASALALTGCASTGGDGDGGAASDGGVTYALAGDPGQLNPVKNATVAAQSLAAFGYESLVSFTAGADPQGLLAEKWEESTTEVRFTLKNGIVCADGSPLKASDVKASFDYAGLKETGSPYRGVYFPATGLKIDADDASRTVTFHSDTPQSFLLATIGLMPVVCHAGSADPGKLDTEWLGTGPYKLVKSSPGQSYTLQLRPEYAWGPGGVTAKTPGLPSTVTVQVVESESTIANMLQSGEVNLGLVAGDDRERLDPLGLNKIDVPARPGLLFFNQAKGRATHDLAVRQALAGAIDRDAVGKVSTGGRGTPMKSLTTSYSNVCKTTDITPAITAFDKNAAAAALDKAGWVKGADGTRAKDGKPLSLVLLYPANSDKSAVSGIELMQQQLAEIGVKATPTPSPSYTDVIFQGGDWDLVWAPISTTLPNTWQGILSGDFPPKGGNWTYNTNKEFFDLAAKAQDQAGENSCDSWQAAQQSLVKDLEVLPFYEATETTYGNGVKFALNSNTLVVPTSLRVSSK